MHCDFFSVPFWGEPPWRDYGVALAVQLDHEMVKHHLSGRRAGSVFFGGGTPSLMPPDFFAGALEVLRKRVELAADCEITCEAGPATADAAWFRAVREAGVTRISVGAQSFHDGLLAELGRSHSADDARRAIGQAQEAGFPSVNVDLMFAIPGERTAMLEEDLRTAMAFRPQHISAYQLTMETPQPQAAGGEPPSSCEVSHSKLVDEEIQLEQMRTAARMLESADWCRYEISNFARPGHECRHNLTYWRYGEWLGLGAGATSFIRDARRETRGAGLKTTAPGLELRASSSTPKTSFLPPQPCTSNPASRVSSLPFGRRWTQTRDVEAYLAGAGALAEEEEIDFRTAMGEFCFLGLRTMAGISRRSFEDLFGVPFEEAYGEAMASLGREGMVVEEGERLFLTARGLEFSNRVFTRFCGCHPR